MNVTDPSPPNPEKGVESRVHPEPDRHGRHRNPEKGVERPSSAGTAGSARWNPEKGVESVLVPDDPAVLGPRNPEKGVERGVRDGDGNGDPQESRKGS